MRRKEKGIHPRGKFEDDEVLKEEFIRCFCVHPHVYGPRQVLLRPAGENEGDLPLVLRLIRYW